MAALRLGSAAWYDERLALEIPDHWQVEVRAAAVGPALDAEAIAAALAAPIGTPPLAELARGRRSAAIVIDDITRPTPTAMLLPPVLRALESAGVARGAIRVVVAAGTHKTASPDEIAKKTGGLPEGIEVVAHDMRASLLEDLGSTARGVPILVNAQVAAADLKMGIGGIYPHPAAGFSGGSKIVAPGVCGFETARRLHDTLPKAGRGHVAASAFRDEVDAIAGRIGLDFIVNAALDQDRQVAALFCGDKVAAYRAGARFVRAAATVPPLEPDAEVVIADAYPFDTYLYFALGRGFWPLAGAGGAALKVGIAACPAGAGGHALDLSLSARLWQRLKSPRLAELGRMAQRLRNLRELVRRRQLQLLLFSPGIDPARIKQRHPGVEVFASWPALIAEVQRRRPQARRVVLYRCAPLLLPAAGAPDDSSGVS